MIIINQVLNYFLVNGGIYQYPHWLGVEFSLPIIYYAVWGAIFGIALTYLGKSWYLDRMVWLYEDMKSESEAYSKWEY